MSKDWTSDLNAERLDNENSTASYYYIIVEFFKLGRIPSWGSLSQSSVVPKLDSSKFGRSNDRTSNDPTWEQLNFEQLNLERLNFGSEST